MADSADIILTEDLEDYREYFDDNEEDSASKTDNAEVNIVISIVWLDNDSLVLFTL